MIPHAPHARTRTHEHGIALIWAILIMLLVLGTITVAAAMTMIRSDESKDDANRTRSSLWVNKASDDLVQRLESREIGYDLFGAGPGPVNADQAIVVPRPTTVPAGTTFPNGGTNVARSLTFTQGGQTYRGWYQVMPIPPGGEAPPVWGASPGGTPWVALHRRSPTRPALQGQIEMTVRVWEEGPRAEPIVVRLVFRKASFSRFSLLSDDRIQLGGVGQVTPGGYVHTNNAPNAPTAINIQAPANTGNAVKITTTRGGIATGGQCAAGKCIANVGDVVEFSAASRAFDRTFEQAATNTPPGVAAYRQGLPDNVAPVAGIGLIPIWIVDLAACGDGIGVWQGTIPLRDDTGGVPVIDDNQAYRPGASLGCINVAEGGGTLLFNGDVVVRGNRTSMRNVTIMAQRRTANDPLAVRLNIDNDVANTFESNIAVSSPANIYLLQNGAPVGSASPWSPVGLVAEGGVYLPSWPMRAGGANGNMVVRNVAAMAMGGEIAYGPSIISVAAEASQPGLGMSPATAAAAPYSYGSAPSLTWSGSLASRRQVVFRYGQGAYLGYGTRVVTYVNELLWNPPAGYPTDRDWHMTDMREYGS